MISLKNTLEAIKEKLSGHDARLSTIEDRHVYSTDEKVIGAWIDGKPLYRKVYSGKALYKGSRVDGFSTSTISTMVKMELCLYGQNPWTASIITPVRLMGVCKWQTMRCNYILAIRQQNLATMS